MKDWHIFKRPYKLTRVKTSYWQKILLVLLGLCLTVILIEIGLCICGSVLLSVQEYRNMRSIREKGTYRILCLGESTTRNQWPHFLEEVLNQRNLGIRFSVIDKGVPGIGSSYICNHIEENVGQYRPHMVITMMGINDRGRWEDAIVSPESNFFCKFKLYKLCRELSRRIITKKESLRLVKTVSGEKTLDNTANRDPAFRQGCYYVSTGDFDKAEEMFNESILKNPENDMAYVELGMLYMPKGQKDKAELMYRKAIEINAKNSEAYFQLGRRHLLDGMYDEAAKEIKQAIKINPTGIRKYIELATTYIFTGKYNEAKELLQEAVAINPGDDVLYGGLSICALKENNMPAYKRYKKLQSEVFMKYYFYLTWGNYLQLKQVLDKKNIKLVCVQYPMRSIEPFKRIFQGEENIIFVDNEKIFRDAIRKESCKEYFVDMFGGDFGHCTCKGNRLLAENIANVILKEVFGK